MSAAMAAGRPQILVISADRVGGRMAGPGIRAYELARALRTEGTVHLAGLDSPDTSGLEVEASSYHLREPGALREQIAAADVVVAQPQWSHIARRLTRSGARLVYDLYTPESIELLERRPPLRPIVTALTEDRIAYALRTGHHFVCASETQRDLWIGAMLGERLLRPRVYDRDPSLQDRLAVVPFGLPSEAPRSGPGARARFPQIGPDDEIVLWNGGLWNWFDAPTAIRAVVKVAERRPAVKLVFMGAASISAGERAGEEARRVAAELGALDTTVLFNDAWVPYEERAGWLLEAACGISTHVDHLETRFSFRTRLLDCFWAGLPVVCTRGDDLAELVERRALGATAPAGDADALAHGLEATLERGRGAHTQALASVAAELSWDRVAEPIRRFLRMPRPRRLGRGVAPRPGELVREAAFRTALRTLHTLGFGWPRL